MRRFYRVILRREIVVEISGESDEPTARRRAANAAIEALVRSPFDVADAEVDRVERDSIRRSDLPKEPTEL